MEIKEAIKTLIGEDGELPEIINSDILCDDILGFEDLESGEKEQNVEEYEEEEDGDENQGDWWFNFIKLLILDLIMKIISLINFIFIEFCFKWKIYFFIIINKINKASF